MNIPWFLSDASLSQTWVEILCNICSSNFGYSPSSEAAGRYSPSLVSPATPASKSLKDPYIHLSDCYSGEKLPHKQNTARVPPPR